ncbi:MAG TPA: RsmB/NOP family class I SAM-dependent RNA methyltransferase [Candidatus Nanoarchaeia archaeon]|nr:RsmB/NOP family class I SAM-dependent RNA methyltransferase [Candidatus Nanoarchaeia archaeon]
MKPELKPLFKDRMQLLLKDSKDFEEFQEIIHKIPRNFIRCNTLKITPEKLMEKLNKKWEVIQPFKENPEIMLINSKLGPGDLGSSIEHVLGYYYVQEISSMMSGVALKPKAGELVFDMCASPGSKSTQLSASMENQGTLITNDFKMDRIIILASNLERCGCSNTVITRMDGVQLCQRFQKTDMKFDKILLDVPCSGEGTLRSSAKTFLMWNPKMIKSLSRMQKKMIANALKVLKVGGELVYSTCTHAPEENEEVLDFAIKNFPIKIEKISLPLKTRPGVTQWNGEKYDEQVKNAHRIYPQDNDSEGFFVAKIKLLEEIREKEIEQ